eukprot:1544339-Rhodomonas_salina.1
MYPLLRAHTHTHSRKRGAVPTCSDTALTCAACAIVHRVTTALRSIAGASDASSVHDVSSREG